MKTWLLFIILCLSFIFFLSKLGNGQIRGIEPATTEKTNPQQIRQLIHEAAAMKMRQQGDSSLLLFLEALRQSTSIDYQEGIDTTIYHLSFDLEALGSAPFYGQIAERALKYAAHAEKKSKEKLSFTRLHKIYGFYLYRNEQYYPAMLTYQKALKSLEASNDTTIAVHKARSIIYYGISALCISLNRFDQAQKWIGNSERIALSKQDTAALIRINWIKGEIYRRLQNSDSAYYYLDKSYRIGKTFLEKDTIPCTCLSSSALALSFVLIDRSKSNQALKILNDELENSLRIIELKKDQGYWHYRDNDIQTFQLMKAYAIFELGDYKAAEKEALNLLDIVQKQGTNIPAKGNVYELLSVVYAAQKRYKDAYFYKKKLADLGNSTTETAKSKAIEAQYEAQKGQALAEKQQLIVRQQSQLREQKIWIGAIAVGILLLGIALLFIYRNNRNKQKLQAASFRNLQQEQEISQLQAKVKGEEQERSRIARDLHDGIVSQLLAVKLNINALQKSGKSSLHPNELNDTALQLEEATQDLRKTAHNLMPDLLLQQGLALSVAALCEKTSRNSTLDIAFQAYGKLPKLQQEIELTLYRMIQELIQNVLKHAEATKLLVQLSCREDYLNITVEDNGKGFPVARLEQNSLEGVGLGNLKRRTEILKGHIDIKSRRDIGTMVYLEFELKNLV